MSDSLDADCVETGFARGRFAPSNGEALMDDADAIGRRLRTLRRVRRRSQAAVAGLAGISASHLSRIESGERALDRRSLIVALAHALDVAPSEIVSGPVIVQGADDAGAPVDAVRVALLAAGMGEPEGSVVTTAELTDRAHTMLRAQQVCDYGTVGAALPALIRDLHTTVDSGRDTAAVLRLLVLVHVQGTQAWLNTYGASSELGWLAANEARQAARRLDEPISAAVAGFGTGLALLGAGSLASAARIVRGADPGTGTATATQLSGMLALTGSLISVAQGNQADRQSAVEYAEDLAERTGEAYALWFGFGPSNVGVWRMSVALDAGEYADAARIGGTIDPAALPNPNRRAMFFREYGRALARLPKRRDEGIMMLRRAELLDPAKIRNHPAMLSLLSELMSRTKPDAAGRELRGLAFRAGLPA